MCIRLLPGLHPWFNLHNLVRHMHNTNGDFSRLWVALALQEVIDPGLQETAQLCVRQPCVGGKQGSTFLFYFVQQLSKEHKEKYQTTESKALTASIGAPSGGCSVTKTA